MTSFFVDKLSLSGAADSVETQLFSEKSLIRLGVSPWYLLSNRHTLIPSAKRP